MKTNKVCAVELGDKQLQLIFRFYHWHIFLKGALSFLPPVQLFFVPQCTVFCPTVHRFLSHSVPLLCPQNTAFLISLPTEHPTETHLPTVSSHSELHIPHSASPQWPSYPPQCHPTVNPISPTVSSHSDLHQVNHHVSTACKNQNAWKI